MYKSITSVAMVALSLTAMAQQTLTCSSTRTRPRLCPANTRKGVILLEERSDNLCDEGQTWVVSKRGITVKGGCSAVFQLGGGTVANGYGNGTNGGNGAGTDSGSSGAGATGNNGAYGSNNNGQNQNGANGYPSGINRTGNNGNQPGYNPNGNNANGRYNNGVNGYPQNNNNGYPQNNNNGYPQTNNGYPQTNNGYPQNGAGNSNPNGINQPGYNSNDSQSRNAGAQDRDRNNGNRGYGDTRREGLVLPSGTRMDVRLEQTVNSSSVNQGDLIAGTLVNDITMNGQVVAPAGTAVQAKIASAQGSPLDMRLDSITIQGQSYALSTNSVHSVRDSTGTPKSGKESTGQQIGSILGAITGGTELPNGSIYSFRLTSETRVGQTR